MKKKDVKYACSNVVQTARLEKKEFSMKYLVTVSCKTMGPPPVVGESPQGSKKIERIDVEVNAEGVEDADTQACAIAKRLKPGHDTYDTVSINPVSQPSSIL